MRVLHVITKLELGGAQQNTLYSCRGLAERGLDVTLAAGPGGLLDEEAERGPFRHVFIPSLRRELRPHRDAAALLALTRLVRSLRPHVVHTHSSKAGVLGRLAAKLGGARAVVHGVHGWSFSDHHPWLARTAYRWVEHALGRMTDHFVSVSERDLDTGRRLGIVRADAGSVIRSGIDVAEFSAEGPGRTELRERWGFAEDDVVVVNVSCLKPQKAPVDFVRAAGIASRREPRLRFMLVGDGVLRADVEEELRREELDGRFVLAGWLTDMPPVFRAADVIALTSRWEGLPRTLVQARVAGKPVVATAVNGSPEVVDEGETGFLLEPGDVEGIAERLTLLGGDAELRHRLGQGGRSSSAEFRREFDQETLVLEQLKLYERLMSGQPGME